MPRRRCGCGSPPTPPAWTAARPRPPTPAGPAAGLTGFTCACMYAGRPLVLTRLNYRPEVHTHPWVLMPCQSGLTGQHDKMVYRSPARPSTCEALREAKHSIPCRRRWPQPCAGWWQWLAWSSTCHHPRPPACSLHETGSSERHWYELLSPASSAPERVQVLAQSHVTCQALCRQGIKRGLHKVFQVVGLLEDSNLRIEHQSSSALHRPARQ